MDIRTKRLIIKPFSEADAEAALDLLTDTQIKKTYMLPDLDKREDALPLFRRLMAISLDESRFVRGIYLEGVLIGFLNDVEIKNGTIELGYVISPDHWGKGYMPEALRAVFPYLFELGYDEVITGAFETNKASIRVMEKAGMRKIHKTEDIDYRGHTHRCIFYSAEKPVLKYPCLVLDHDDTVVRSEETVNYPYFAYILDKFRPGTTITLKEYVQGCSDLGFAQMCRQWYGFTEAELEEEYRGWKEYIRHHIPEAFPGIGDIIRRQKELGGKICVVSMSSEENIRRDYQVHFGIEPDIIFGWDMAEAHRKPSPYALKQCMELYGLSPSQLLVVDDMKPAWEMARSAGVEIGFAAWGRLEYPEIMKEMAHICDHTFCRTGELEEFLFGG